MDTKTSERRKAASRKYSATARGKAYYAEWRVKNKLKNREYQKMYYRANPERAKQWAKNWQQRNPERYLRSIQNNHLRTVFGISIEDYEAMLVKQHGGCAICGAKTSGNRRLTVDHCHSTGKIRGILCVKCNSGLGNFKDDPHLMIEAITYLMGVQ